MRVQHFDRISIRWDASTLRVNPDKTRTVDGFGAHVGNYTYHDDKGQPFIEHVPASTLFDAASLDSAMGSTLTIRHGPGLVGPEQYRAESHGAWVKSWDAGGGLLGVRARLGSAEAIKFVDDAIDKGVSVELSPVYEVDVADEPGTTEHGRHDAVQRDRVYSGIALLGPDEARGGSGMRLQLDGPECAPVGSRMQVSRGHRLDRAPRVPLHSETPGRSTMKQYKLKGRGGERPATQTLLDSLRAIGKIGLDAIETVAISATGPDGETDELSLPLAMWEAMLEGIGAGAAAAAPPAEAMPVEEEVSMESRDAEEDEDKLDSKTVGQMIKVALDKHDAKRTAADALTATVNADAGRVLPPGYDYRVHWTQVAIDAIAMGSPESETRAKEFVKKAVNGDAVSKGRLLEMLSQSVREFGPKTSSTPSPKLDGPEPAPWKSPVMPKVSN